MTVALCNRHLLYAVYRAAQDLDAPRFAWVEEADLWPLYFWPEAPYKGPPVVHLPGLSPEARRAIQRRLIEVLAREERRVAKVLTPLNLREGPGIRYPVLQTLPVGATLQVLGDWEDWLQVRYQDQTGFVHRDYVKLPGEMRSPGLLREEEDLWQIPPETPPALQIALPHAAAGSLEGLMADLWNRYGRLTAVAALEMKVDPDVALAVLATESGPLASRTTSRMVLRFEVHVFYREWGQAHAERFARHFAYDPRRPWTGHHWRRDPDGPWQPVHTGHQESEWAAFEFARRLDPEAACRSASMGLAQIMGFNHRALGYPSAEAMFHALAAGPTGQILALFDFVGNRHGLGPLRRHDLLAFAEIYNGVGQAPVYAEALEARLDALRRLRAGLPAPAEPVRGAPPAPEAEPSGPWTVPEPWPDLAALEAILRTRLRRERWAWRVEQALVIAAFLLLVSGLLLALWGQNLAGAFLAGLLAVGLLFVYQYGRLQARVSGRAEVIRELEGLLARCERVAV